jgi:hypothetical protein
MIDKFCLNLAKACFIQISSPSAKADCNSFDNYPKKYPKFHSSKLLYQTENGWRKNCGSPHEVRAQKRHTYFVRVSAIFANQFCLGIKTERGHYCPQLFDGE